MKTKITEDINKLHRSDIYSLMLFILYKLHDLPGYAVLSELCFLLDGNSLTRILNNFAGQTITIPTAEEFEKVINALLLYQYINIDGLSLTEAQMKLGKMSNKENTEVTNLYLQILPIMENYNINRGQVQKDGR